MSFLTLEDKPVEDIQSININIDIFNEIDTLFQEKLLDEDYENCEDEEDEDGERKEDPLEIIEEILEKIEITKDNAIVLKDMKNNLLKLNKIAQENGDENQQENVSNIESLQIMINEKMVKFDDFLQNMNNEQKSYIKKINNLKKSIITVNNEMTTLKEDYKILYEKYNSNQELEVDDEMERLLDENVALNQELNSKKEEINNLINDRSERDKQINELYIKLEESQKNEKELRSQIAELKIANNKQKEDYENLMDTVVTKIEKKEKEEKKEREKIKEMIEKQLKNEEEKKTENDKKEQEGQIQIKELNNIDNMNIPLTEKLLKKKKILSQLSNEKLMEYALKLERLNITLKSEKNKLDSTIKEKDAKIQKLNILISNNKKEIGLLNIEIKKLQAINASLQKEVKNNEIFRPSIAMTGQMRISRMSKLNTAGVNEMKFSGFKNKKNMNSIDYYKNDKNMNFSIGKKNIKLSKLKDTNINVQIGKEQKTKFTPQTILNSIYGNGEQITEEQNEEDNDQIPSKNEKKDEINNEKEEKKNNFEISNNSQSTIEGHKMPFTNLQQNCIEIDIQKKVNDIGENEIITIDSINDINLGGSTKEIIEIDKEGKNESEQNENNSTDHKTTVSFFESKPLENNLDVFEKKTTLDKLHSNKTDNYSEMQNKAYGGIFSNNIQSSDTIEKKAFNASTELYGDDLERDTLQVNPNENMTGGLEDMIFNKIDDEDDIKINTGRESDNNTRKMNKLQKEKFGINIENGKKD